MSTGFIYKWTNTIDRKWYIGSHKGTPDDGYRHSSKILKNVERKYSPNNFLREILLLGDYEKDKIKTLEGLLLKQLKAATNPMSYNQTNMTGPDTFSKEVREKISKSGKGKNKGNIPWNKGKKCPKHSKVMKGKTQSKESNLKRSESLKGRQRSKEHCKNISKSHIGKLSPNFGNRYKHEIIQCPHCEKSGGIGAMKRHHFDNCKRNKL